MMDFLSSQLGSSLRPLGKIQDLPCPVSYKDGAEDGKCDLDFNLRTLIPPKWKNGANLFERRPHCSTLNSPYQLSFFASCRVPSTMVCRIPEVDDASDSNDNMLTASAISESVVIDTRDSDDDDDGGNELPQLDLKATKGNDSANFRSSLSPEEDTIPNEVLNEPIYDPIYGQEQEAEKAQLE
jgi:hypothetical protein